MKRNEEFKIMARKEEDEVESDEGSVEEIECRFSEDDIDDEDENYNEEQGKNRRGKNREFFIIATYENMNKALLDFTQDQLNADGRIRGRSVKADNRSYTFHCNYKTCGCDKTWRLSLDDYKTSDLVLLLESVGDHSNHDEYVRNGGYGLSFDQVDMITNALHSHCRTPLLILREMKEKNKANFAKGLLT